MSKKETSHIQNHEFTTDTGCIIMADIDTQEKSLLFQLKLYAHNTTIVMES